MGWLECGQDGFLVYRKVKVLEPWQIRQAELMRNAL